MEHDLPERPASPQYVVQKVEAVNATRVVMAIGSGVKRDPYRIVTEWWFEGRKLARDDPFEPPDSAPAEPR